MIKEGEGMTTLIKRVKLTRNFDLYVSVGWWNPLERIEIKRSFKALREGLYSSHVSFIEIEIALLCVKVEFCINRSNNMYEEEIND